MIDPDEADDLRAQDRHTRRRDKAENRRAWDPDREPEPADEQPQENEE